MNKVEGCQHKSLVSGVAAAIWSVPLGGGDLRREREDVTEACEFDHALARGKRINRSARPNAKGRSDASEEGDWGKTGVTQHRASSK